MNGLYFIGEEISDTFILKIFHFQFQFHFKEMSTKDEEEVIKNINGFNPF